MAGEHREKVGRRRCRRSECRETLTKLEVGRRVVDAGDRELSHTATMRSRQRSLKAGPEEYRDSGYEKTPAEAGVFSPQRERPR